MFNKHDDFMIYVTDYIKENPDAMPLLISACAEGLALSRAQIQERCADMEAALCQSLYYRLGKTRGFILEKLKKWNGKSSMRWDYLIEKLEDLKT